MDLLAALALATSTFGLPNGLLSAVCYVESNHRLGAIRHNDGMGDSLGPCQVQEATARHLGYRGSRHQLRYDPVTNAHWAAAYLSKQLRRYDGDLHKAVSAYNMGTYKVNSTGQTANSRYVRKVFEAWDDKR